MASQVTFIMQSVSSTWNSSTVNFSPCSIRNNTTNTTIYNTITASTRNPNNTLSATVNISLIAGNQYTFTCGVSTLSQVTTTSGVQFKIILNTIPETNTSFVSTIVTRSTARGTISLTAACLHGSSMVQMRDNLKRLDKINSDDVVVSGKNLDEYAKVKSLVTCWLSIEDKDPIHDAIIFEPGSLGYNEPTERLIIDPSHPICTRKDFLEKGNSALKPAADYWEQLKGDKVYTKKWTDPLIQKDQSRRYDLLLEEPYTNYVANGIMIQSGCKPYTYKNFI